MVIFDFNEYFMKGCVIPCICFMLGLAIVIASIFKLIKNYRGISQYTFIKRFSSILLPTMFLAFGVVFLSIIGQTLKYGIFLFGEKSLDTLRQVGQVETIQPISLPPQYNANELSGQPVEVKIDGSVYYFMSGNELALNDTIEFWYLPKSKMVLSYQFISYSAYLNQVKVEESSEQISEIDPIFALVFTVVIVLFAFFAKSQYLDHKLEQAVQIDDAKWDKNEVRFHESYVKIAVIFSLIVFLACGLLSLLFSTFLILFLGTMVSFVGFVLMFIEYKYWRFMYTANKITVVNYAGREETILCSNIISINESIENRFFSRGAVYTVITIKYRSFSLKRMIEQTIKLDYRHHVGISRFLNYYRAKKNNFR